MSIVLFLLYEDNTSLLRRFLVLGIVLGIGHINNTVKMHFFKSLLLYFRAWMRQIKYMYLFMMTQELSTKILNFMTPGLGFLC